MHLPGRIGRAVGKDVEIVHIDRRDIDNIRRRVVNIEKARRMLRWSPQVTLTDGLARTAAWMRAEAASFQSTPVTSATSDAS